MEDLDSDSSDISRRTRCTNTNVTQTPFHFRSWGLIDHTTRISFFLGFRNSAAFKERKKGTESKKEEFLVHAATIVRALVGLENRGENEEKDKERERQYRKAVSLPWYQLRATASNKI